MLNNNTLRIGDLLTRPKDGGLITHMGVAAGPGWVLENVPGKGERLVPLQEFVNGGQIKVISTGANEQAVLTRIRRILSRPQRYNAATRNCEHTAYEVIYGIAKSPQFIGFIIIALVCGFL